MEVELDSLASVYIPPCKPEVISKQPTDETADVVECDYLTVLSIDPIKEWKVEHEKAMFEKLIASQQNLREKQCTYKQNLSIMLRKVPVLLITKEFLNKEKMSIDSRAYIIDNLIPVVVLGLEKLLLEADKKGLIEKTSKDPNFNPINFLAQYLMRNNPSYSNFNEASPYVRGLRQVVEELKMEIFHLSDNKLARVKASAKNQRREREKEEERKRQENQRRIEIYHNLFDQFLLNEQTKVDYETIHLSIKSFSEIVSKFPDEMKHKLQPILKMEYSESTRTMKKLGRQDFSLLIANYASEMPVDIFSQFTDHLSKCAMLYHSSTAKEIRRKLLTTLFMTCDLDELGLLDRQRLLMLFDQFYSKAPENIKETLRDPRHWPISDYSVKFARENTNQNASARNRLTIKDMNTANVVDGVEGDQDDDINVKSEIDSVTSVEENDDGRKSVTSTFDDKKIDDNIKDETSFKVDNEDAEENLERIEESGRGNQQIAEEPGGRNQEKTDEPGEGYQQIAEEPVGGNQERTEEPGGGNQQIAEEPLGGNQERTEEPGGGNQQIAEEPLGGNQERTEEPGGGNQQIAEEPVGGNQERTEEPGGGNQERTEEPGGNHERRNESVGLKEALLNKVSTELVGQQSAVNEVEETVERVKEEKEAPEIIEEMKKTVKDVPKEITDNIKDGASTLQEDISNVVDEGETVSLSVTEAQPQKPVDEPRDVPVVDSSDTEDVLEDELLDSRQQKITSQKSERHVTIVDDFRKEDESQVNTEDETDTDSKEIDRELTKLSAITQSSVFDDENINVGQFCQITEEFLGKSPKLEIVEDLMEFIRENYRETPEERLRRIQKAHRQVVSANRKSIIDELFLAWDLNNSGSISMREVTEILGQYKNGFLLEGIKAAKAEARMRITRRTKDIKLNRKEFRTFIYTIARVCELLEVEGEIETMLNYFIGFVHNTYVEKLRADARRKWLSHILWAAEISCGYMDGVYRSVFQALYKDVENHGDGKKISGSIALLENNSKNVENRGKYLLHFVAATVDQADYVVGKIVDRSIPNISFQAIYSGNVVHLVHASTNHNVIFWNPDVTESAKEGSLVVVPVKDDFQRVFGVLSVDTVNDLDRSSFSSHEISFYQGLAKQFGIAFKQVEMLRRFIKVSESAASWICRRILSVQNVTLYTREKYDSKSTVEFVLRKILSNNSLGELDHFEKPMRLEKGDNLFKSYLFDAMEHSQSISADAYGERYLAIPMRDLNGMAISVFDISIGETKMLPSAENAEMARLMGLLQQAYYEIINASQLSDSDVSLDNTKTEESLNSESFVISASDSYRTDMIFDQLMLSDLRATIAKLDVQAYAELKSYKDPPVTIHAIIQALLSMLHPKEAATGLFKNWEKCKKFISVSLNKQILSFDPFGDVSNVPLDLVREAMEKIPHSEIDKRSSKPSQDLYNWVFCCASLIAHRIKMERSAEMLH